jgi:hypothetical protein
VVTADAWTVDGVTRRRPWLRDLEGLARSGPSTFFRHAWRPVVRRRIAAARAVIAASLGVASAAPAASPSAPVTEAGVALSPVAEAGVLEPVRGRVGFAPVGAITYSRETSAMVGTAGVLFFKPPEHVLRRTSQITVGAAYSVRRQLVATVNGDLFVWHDAARFQFAANYLYYPDSFFGIGNATRLSDQERFTPRTYELRVAPQVHAFGALFLGPTFRIEDVTILSVDPNGALATGDVFGSQGGFDFSFGVGASYDTRDNTLYPLRGTSFQYYTLVSEPRLGSDFRMSRTWLDYRRYFPIVHTEHVLAVQLLGRFGQGELPFFDLGRLGGERLLRGHFNGRYRDRQLIAAQAEYRLPIVWRLGAVAFVGLGDVARRLSDLEVLELKYSLGGGARLNVSKHERVNLRADFGWGGDEYDAYVSVGEVF